MIILDGNTQSFQAVLAGAVSSDQPEFQATYGKLNAGVLDSYLTNQGELNSTTDVNIVAGVASRQIGIKTISVFNRDNAQVTITFKKDISATDRLIYRATLEANESVHYESERGWYICNVSGVEKSANSAIKGILGQLAPGATTLTDLYTVPAQKTATVHIIITNRSTATTFRVAAAVDGAADDNKQYLVYDKDIAANDTVATVTFELGADDKVRVYAGSANLSFTCTGIEEY